MNVKAARENMPCKQKHLHIAIVDHTRNNAEGNQTNQKAITDWFNQHTHSQSFNQFYISVLCFLGKTKRNNTATNNNIIIIITPTKKSLNAVQHTHIHSSIDFTKCSCEFCMHKVHLPSTVHCTDRLTWHMYAFI